MRAAAVLVATAVASLAGATAAFGHGVVGLSGSTITYTATDDPTQNTVSVTAAPGSKCRAARCVQIADPTVDPGMDPGPCTGASAHDPHVVFCPWKAGTRIRMDLGELDDRAEVDVPIPADLRGGAGDDTLIGSRADDRLAGGPGDDTLRGGAGNDQLLGDSGADTLDGGAGDDVVSAVDGAADQVACGAGLDAVDADAADALAGDCEDFTTVADLNAAPPVLRLAAVAAQRVGGSGAVVARVRTGTPGSVSLSGEARAGARRFALGPVSATTKGAGWVRVAVPLPASAVRALRRGRLAVTLVAKSSDGTGASAQTTQTGIRLRR